MHMYTCHYVEFEASFLAVMCIICLENSEKKENEYTLLCEFENKEIGIKSLLFEVFSPPSQQYADYVSKMGDYWLHRDSLVCNEHSRNLYTPYSTLHNTLGLSIQICYDDPIKQHLFFHYEAVSCTFNAITTLYLTCWFWPSCA